MPPVLANLNRMSISLHPDTSESPAMAASPDAGAAQMTGSPDTKIRSRLFTKYVALFVAVVAVALLSNGIFEVFFYYREHKAALIRIQHEQAEAAAAKIGQFIKEIESQLGWTTQLPWSAKSIEDRRFDALRLLKQVPAITELAQVDSTGIERLRVSRLTHGFGVRRRRSVERSEVHRSRRQQGLLRAGIFPPRVGAVYDALPCRHPQGSRHQYCRGQSQADPGCGVADQGRRAWSGLCRGCGGAPDRASGY